MNKKKIKILTKGIITVKGFIYGPVLTPYYEDLDTIFEMLSTGIKVVEVLDDGTEVELSIMNFNTDNSSKKTSRKNNNTKTAPTQETTTVESHVEEHTNVEDTDTAETTMTSDLVETTDEVASQNTTENTVTVDENTTEEFEETTDDVEVTDNEELATDDVLVTEETNENVSDAEQDTKEIASEEVTNKPEKNNGYYKNNKNKNKNRH